MTEITREAVREAVAKAACRECCAFMGEPPCFEVTGDSGEELPWPNPDCDAPGCGAIADAALSALTALGLAVVPVATLQAALSLAEASESEYRKTEAGELLRAAMRKEAARDE